MIKSIKFDLKLNNGETLRTLDDLKNNLSSELFEHFQSGKLAKWLRVRKLEEQADAVEKLLTEIHDREVRSFKGLIELFGGEANVDSLRTAITERKKALPSFGQNLDDEVEQLKATFEKEIEALKAEMELLKNPPKPIIKETRIEKFIVLDVTATDPTTGLTWSRYAVGQGLKDGAIFGEPLRMTWADALKAADNFNKIQFGGFDNWRLPTLKELTSLVRLNKNPSIDTAVFPNTPLLFWSSSVDNSNGYARVKRINFHNGESLSRSDHENMAYYVRLVRS